MDRDIIRVVTPGTVIASSMLEEGKNNYICAIYMDSAACGLCLCDISTGEVYASSFPAGEEGLGHLQNELARFHLGKPRGAGQNLLGHGHAHKKSS